MKKITLLTLALLLGIFVITSCQKDCKNCKSVKTNDTSGAVEQEGSSSEYCDTALDEKESEPPATVGGSTTKWVCE